MKIGFIGLGRLGLPCATVIAKKGYDITGYDINNIKSNIITIKNSFKDVIDLLPQGDYVIVVNNKEHNKVHDKSLCFLWSKCIKGGL